MESQESTTYTLTSIAVSGVPRAFAFKNSYSVRLHIDGEEGWMSGRVQKRSDKIEWKGKECEYDFTLSPMSVLEVVVCRQRQGQNADAEIGAVSLAWRDWMSANFTAPLATGSGQLKTPMLASIRVEEKRTAASATSSPAPAAQGPVDSRALEARKEQDNVQAPRKGLLSDLDQFNELVNSITEVRSYTGMAATIFNGHLKAETQHRKDKKLQELIQKVKMTFEFVRVAHDLPQDSARADVLSCLAQQTVDCAYFFSLVLEDTNFVKQLSKQNTTGVEDKVDEYNRSFDELFIALRTGSQIQTELCTTLILDNIREIAATIAVSRIPYVGGAGYEPSRRCPNNKHEAVLENIMDWAFLGEGNESRVLLLVGEAGTGKSSVAHTLAHQVRQMNCLGAFFCFSASTSATRKLVSLFQNIARGLADRYPAYKTALVGAINHDTDLSTTEDLNLQFERFLLWPSDCMCINSKILIIIDALNESGTPSERCDLIPLLFSRLQELPPYFRIVLTSREEPDITSYILCSTVTVKHLSSDRTISIQEYSNPWL